MIFTELDRTQQQLYWTLLGVFFMSLAGYWLVRPLKMGVFVALVGIEHEPQAKLGTVILLGPLLMVYNKVYSMVPSARLLVLVVGGVYAVVFAFVTLALQGLDESGSHGGVGGGGGGGRSSTGSAGAGADNLSQHHHQQQHQQRRLFSALPFEQDGEDEQPSSTAISPAVGWIVYWTIESFGSIIMPMLWSVTASFTDAPTAAVVYPVIVVCQQLGALAGATLATYTASFGEL